ncbi:hypothetical protein GU700_24405 [Methylobacterium sp. NI91]|nr:MULTISPECIES: hypothetical protein [unclassified Methylobacterium]QIJ77449.1 hypothetical protein CLZ_24410 [Methylobacterium sp. CLZ]QIJ82352.1 hypothetical protein GU700_24405 [Methylobacterium sp. NI91]
MIYRDRDEGDRALGYYWRVSPGMVERIGLHPGVRVPEQRARRSIVAALALAAETDRRWISYSRTRGWYAGGAHYPGCDYTYDTVVPAVDELIEAGLVEEVRGLVREGGSGIQSRMRASPLFLERLGADLSVEHVGPGCYLVMRDEDGRMAPLPRTEEVHRMLKGMEAVNEGVRPLRLTVSPKADQSNWRIGERQWAARKIGKDGKERWVYVLPTPHHYFIRILGRGRVDCHGRLYGWAQGLPKLRRAELLLNGDPVAEPDFEHIHPTLLYAIAGIPLTYDPYDTQVIERDHTKLALNVAINAPGGRTGAINALAWHPKWRKEWKLDYRAAERAYDEVAKLNAPIARFLGSDAGIRLMGLDSRMCLSVLKGCRKAAIPALPVHDSFIVPATRKGDVEAIMDQARHETRVAISPGSSMASVKTILQAPFAAAASSARPCSPAREASSVRSASSVKKRTGKAVSRPARPSLSAKASPVLPVVGEALPASWDLAERTLALREDFERAVLARHRKLAAGAASGWRQAPSASERRHDLAQARGLAEWTAEQEQSSGLCAAGGVPYALSDEAKAKRAKRLAPKTRRPMPRPRRPSTYWAKPEAAPTLAQAKPQEALGEGKAKPEAAQAPVKAKPASRPARSLAALLRSRDPILVPEEQGPGWIADPRRRPDGISARSYEGRWFALGRVPREPEGGHEPPGGPVATLRAAPGCAPYPSRPRAW